MNDQANHSEIQDFERHSAGATVRHENPFTHLPTPSNEEPLSKEVLQKWVIPFYMRTLGAKDVEWLEDGAWIAVCREATPEITLSLLSEFNWRTRSVGARLVAVRRFTELQEPISNLLLKSEVCYAGNEYCLALASFKNQSAVYTLCQYLDYYLQRTDLWFDQNTALSALIYLDEHLHLNSTSQFREPYKAFIADKPNWNLQASIQHFRLTMNVIEQTRLQLN